MFRRGFLWLMLACSGLLLGGQSQAATLQYETVDLPDLVIGQDLWRYDYRVTGSFETFGGLNLLYDPAKYLALSDPQPSPSANWDVSVVSPNTALPAPGLFGATRLTDAPALNEALSVQFIWLGSGRPGAQPYEVFNTTFDITGSGFTAAVPEPETYTLFGLGLLVIGLRLSRRKPARQV